MTTDIHYMAEQEWQYRRDVELPMKARLGALVHENRLSVAREQRSEPSRRRAVARWLGQRLVTAGQRLGAGPAATARA
jgi:hypothetical protein